MAIKNAIIMRNDNGTTTTTLQIETANTVDTVFTPAALAGSATQAFSASVFNDSATVTVASAATTDIGAAASNNVDISGTVTITSFGTVAAGVTKRGRFTGILTLTHNATSLILPGVENIITAADDRYEALSLGAGNWIITKYQKSNGIGLTGGVLQVVNLVYSTQGSQAIAATTDTAVTGMALSITPKGNNSKFRIDVRLFSESNDAHNNVYNILRGTARINTTSNLPYHGLSMATQTFGEGEDNDSTPEILDFSTIDSTGSVAGTAIDYKLIITTAIARTLWINRCFNAPANQYETGISEIIITELGA